MKISLYSLLILYFSYSIGFSNFHNVMSASDKKIPEVEDCLTSENFEMAFKYIHWKHHTAKKLSKHKKVLFEDGW